MSVNSKSVLWLGLLFVLLLSVFCITTHLDELNPQIRRVETPAPELLAKNETTPLPVQIQNKEKPLFVPVPITETVGSAPEQAQPEQAQPEQAQPEQATTPLPKPAKPAVVKSKKRISKRTVPTKEPKILVSSILKSRTLHWYPDQKKFTFEQKRVLNFLLHPVRFDKTQAILIKATGFNISTKEAKAVALKTKKYLLEHGISPDRVKSKWKTYHIPTKAVKEVTLDITVVKRKRP